MDQHLSVSEARHFTGKSESTIKRLLREITGDPAHPDRLLILPPPEEVERRRAAKEPYVWKIDRQLLLRRFPADEVSGANGNAPPQPSSAIPSELVLQVLQEQLKSKDEQLRTLETQLDRKDDQIANLNERMRESNVLMRELQQRLAIAPPKPVTPDSAVEAPTVPSRPAAAPRASQKKPKAAKSPERRNIFGRLFRHSQ